MAPGEQPYIFALLPSTNREKSELLEKKYRTFGIFLGFRKLVPIISVLYRIYEKYNFRSLLLLLFSSWQKHSRTLNIIWIQNFYVKYERSRIVDRWVYLFIAENYQSEIDLYVYIITEMWDKSHLQFYTSVSLPRESEF